MIASTTMMHIGSAKLQLLQDATTGASTGVTNMFAVG